MDKDQLGHLGAREELDNTELDESNFVQVAYRHKGIANFRVGDFEFKDHILRIGPGPIDQIQPLVDTFVKLYHGLQGNDRAQIVQLRNVENEIAVDRAPSLSVRGAVGSTDVSDRPAEAPGSAETPLSQPTNKPAFLGR